MRRRPSNPPCAFTLVELLVVIGIIAILIGILLPVLSSINERGRDLKCQANLRSILQALHGYAAENKGSMPWGYVYNRAEPVHWNPEDGTLDEVICWASLLANYMNRSYPIVGPFLNLSNIPASRSGPHFPR